MILSNSVCGDLPFNSFNITDTAVFQKKGLLMKQEIFSTPPTSSCIFLGLWWHLCCEWRGMRVTGDRCAAAEMSSGRVMLCQLVYFLRDRVLLPEGKSGRLTSLPSHSNVRVFVFGVTVFTHPHTGNEVSCVDWIPVCFSGSSILLFELLQDYKWGKPCRCPQVLCLLKFMLGAVMFRVTTLHHLLSVAVQKHISLRHPWLCAAD